MTKNRKMVFNKLIRRNSRGIKREIFKLVNTEHFSHSEINLILHIRNNRTLSHLSKITQVQKSNMSKLIDSLEERDIVTRNKDERDKRIIFIVLTKKGEEIRNKLVIEYEKNLNEILKNVSEEEIENAIVALEIIKDKIWG